LTLSIILRILIVVTKISADISWICAAIPPQYPYKPLYSSSWTTQTPQVWHNDRRRCSW